MYHKTFIINIIRDYVVFGVAMIYLCNNRKNRMLLWKKIRSMKMLYLFMLVPFGFIILFNYVPIYGVIIAFKDYRYVDGIIGSQWNHFEHFRLLFRDALFKRAFLNTIRISLARILFTFPMPILLALLINELRNRKYKRIVQTISYLPHFMSWIIISVIVNQMLSMDYGVFNAIVTSLGGDAVYFQGEKKLFLPILIIAQIWQSTGWGSIIYLAAMSSINPELYEASEIDGANRFNKAIHITIPSIAPIIVIQFILSFSGIMKGGFDAIFNLYNDLVMDVADIIDTYSYRTGIQNGRYAYATAIGLFQNVIGFAMVLLVNAIMRKFSDYALW